MATVEARTPSAARGERLARTLGWVSVGLGVSQLVTPRTLARLIGVPERAALFRWLGARELASGVGILARRRPAGWLWARVAGDAVDLGLLGAALRSRAGVPARVAAAAGAVAGVTVLDALCARRLSADGRPARSTVSMGINRPPEEIYRAWKDIACLARVAPEGATIRRVGDGTVRCAIRAPGGFEAVWDAEVVEDRPGERIAWRSADGVRSPTTVAVQIDAAPAGRGSRVTVEVVHPSLAGAVVSGVAKAIGRAPDQLAKETLRRFKQLMETGEIATTTGQPSGPS